MGIDGRDGSRVNILNDCCFHNFFNRRWTQTRLLPASARRVNADEKEYGDRRDASPTVCRSPFHWSGFSTDRKNGKTYGKVLGGSDWR